MTTIIPPEAFQTVYQFGLVVLFGLIFVHIVLVFPQVVVPWIYHHIVGLYKKSEVEK